MSRLVLIGCGKSKKRYALQARELYTGPLFVKRRGYAEASGEEWAILSALHGITKPEQVLRPYDKTLESAAAVQNLAGLLAFQLRPEGAWSHVTELEVHAGSLYREAVLRAARKLSITMTVPFHGLSIGKQLQWYASRGF